MTKIIVTTDNSELGHLAVPHAQALGKALGAEVLVLSIYPDPVPVAVEGFAYVAPVSASELTQQITELREQMGKAIPGARVLVEQAAGRPLWKAILDCAQAEKAQMIVMTTHGRRGISRALLGSVAEGVVQHSDIPVLLIHGEQPVVVWGS